MKMLNLKQGSTEWHETRAMHFCASEAPAMLGLSKYQTRTDLLDAKAGAEKPEINMYTQALFDKGHATEEAARNILKDEHGLDFKPTVAIWGDDSLPLLASYDGIEFDFMIGFEHKLWNQSLAAQVAAGVVPEEYKPQLEQQLMIADLLFIKFVVSDGTTENFVSVDYYGCADVRQKLLAGWALFLADLAKHTIKPKLQAVITNQLPCLAAVVQGKVVETNVGIYKASALAIIQGINTALVNDQDFKNAEGDVKWCANAEAEIKKAKVDIVNQTTTIAELLAVLDEISEAVRQKRLALEKLVKTEKELRKAQIFAGVQKDFAAFVEGLNAGLKYKLPTIIEGLDDAAKGKKTLASIEQACKSLFLEVCGVATKQAAQIKENTALIEATGQPVLFVDAANLVATLSAESLGAVIESRVAQAAAQAKRLEEAAALVVSASADLKQDLADIKAKTETIKTLQLHDDCCEEAGAFVAMPEIISLDDFVELLQIDESLVVIRQPQGLLYKAMIGKQYTKIEAKTIANLFTLYKKHSQKEA